LNLVLKLKKIDPEEVEKDILEFKNSAYIPDEAEGGYNIYNYNKENDLDTISEHNNDNENI